MSRNQETEATFGVKLEAWAKYNQSPKYKECHRKAIAIRREDFNLWECRAPLSPCHVRLLVRKGVKVIVQPSHRRAYSNEDYKRAGATVQENTSEASLILGINRLPADQLVPDRTYCFYSELLKATRGTSELLDSVLAKNIRLLDYECLVDAEGKQRISSGRHAGMAGLVNIIRGLALRLRALGHFTPFLTLGLAQQYRSTDRLKQAVRVTGYEIVLGSIQRNLGPIIFVFTGSGDDINGARELFDEFPCEWVEVEELPRIAQQGSMEKLYGCHVTEHQLYEKKESWLAPFTNIHMDELFRLDMLGRKSYSPESVRDNPENYVSTFSSKIAPYATCVINSIQYRSGHPRLLTTEEAKAIVHPQSASIFRHFEKSSSVLRHRLLAVCDLTAEKRGCFGFIDRWNSPENPFFLYDARRRRLVESIEGDGLLVSSMPHLPALFATESTDYFGDQLMPFMDELLRSDATISFSKFDASSAVKKAVIATNGRLTKGFGYLRSMEKNGEIQ